MISQTKWLLVFLFCCIAFSQERSGRRSKRYSLSYSLNPNYKAYDDGYRSIYGQNSVYRTANQRLPIPVVYCFPFGYYYYQCPVWNPINYHIFSPGVEEIWPSRPIYNSKPELNPSAKEAQNESATDETILLETKKSSASIGTQGRQLEFLPEESERDKLICRTASSATIEPSTEEREEGGNKTHFTIEINETDLDEGADNVTTSTILPSETEILPLDEDQTSNVQNRASIDALFSTPDHTLQNESVAPTEKPDSTNEIIAEIERPGVKDDRNINLSEDHDNSTESEPSEDQDYSYFQVDDWEGVPVPDSSGNKTDGDKITKVNSNTTDIDDLSPLSEDRFPNKRAPNAHLISATVNTIAPKLTPVTQPQTTKSPRKTKKPPTGFRN